MMVATTTTSRRALRLRSHLSSLATCALTFVLIEVGSAHLARAEDDSTETAAARSLAVEGLKLADAGRCADAVEKLTRAEKLHHGPIVLGRLGECQIALGKLVDGTENLRKVLREPLPSNPSAALVKARERAQVALDTAKPRIGSLTISVKGARDNSAVTVTVDGQSVSSALLDTDRPTDPGEHVVEASAQGFLKAATKVNVGPADKQSVTLKLEADPNYVPPTTPEAAANAGRAAGSSDANAQASRDAGVSSSNAPPGPPNRAGAYIAWAFGGAAVAVGAGFGVVALKNKSTLSDNCPGNVCQQNQSHTLDSAKTAGTISTIAFAVGGAGLALGTVLYFTATPSSSGSGARGSTRAWVGLGQVGFARDF